MGLLSDDIASNVVNCENTYEEKLEDNESTVRISASLVQNAQTKEICYRLDSDFFHPVKLATDTLQPTLEFLHERATHLIQWAITPKLHKAMEPTEI
jgi:uncharacterized protein (TIGR04255 family)